MSNDLKDDDDFLFFDPIGFFMLILLIVSIFVATYLFIVGFIYEL